VLVNEEMRNVGYHQQKGRNHTIIFAFAMKKAK